MIRSVRVREVLPTLRRHGVVEAVGGVLGAASKVPFAILPCVVGGVLKASRPDLSEGRVGAVLDITNGVQSGFGLTTAIASGGVADFVSTLLTKGVLTGVTVTMVSRGGSSLELARSLDRELKGRITPQTSLGGALWKGTTTGLKVALTDGARVGYSEGRGYALGGKEVTRELPRILAGEYDPAGATRRDS
ncbi:MAG: hypothetical protein AB1758_25970, partial [Candidatus Eremiobacterota bacterium]